MKKPTAYEVSKMGSPQPEPAEDAKATQLKKIKNLRNMLQGDHDRAVREMKEEEDNRFLEAIASPKVVPLKIRSPEEIEERRAKEEEDFLKACYAMGYRSKPNSLDYMEEKQRMRAASSWEYRRQ